MQAKESLCCKGEVFHNRCTSTRDIPFFIPPKDDGFSNRRVQIFSSKKSTNLDSWTNFSKVPKKFEGLDFSHL